MAISTHGDIATFPWYNGAMMEIKIQHEKLDVILQLAISLGADTLQMQLMAKRLHRDHTGMSEYDHMCDIIEFELKDGDPVVRAILATEVGNLTHDWLGRTFSFAEQNLSGERIIFQARKLTGERCGGDEVSETVFTLTLSRESLTFPPTPPPELTDMDVSFIRDEIAEVMMPYISDGKSMDRLSHVDFWDSTLRQAHNYVRSDKKDEDFKR